MSNNKALMTHYLEGALISRELHDMMYESAAEARFEAELSSYEENLAERTYSGKAYGAYARKKEKFT